MHKDGNEARVGEALERLDLLKTLGDNTRYAIYLELARSPTPLTTAEIAATLELHPNTVRPHLERMREVGLLLVSTEARGSVGRPQHRYSLSEEAPALGLEPSPWPTMARALLEAASAGGLKGEEMAEAGFEQGHSAAGHTDEPQLAALVLQQTRLGFDPEVASDETGTTLAFAHCPFRELAEQQPELVCSLHCGLVEGFLAASGEGTIARFHSLVDRTPCRVDLVGV